MSFLVKFGIVLAVGLSPAVSLAGLIIQVGDGLGKNSTGYVFNSGQIATMPVYGYVTGTTPRGVDSYDLAFDFDTSGFGYSDSFLGKISLESTGFGNPALKFDTAIDLHNIPQIGDSVKFDFQVNASPMSDISNDQANPTHLFNLLFATSDSTPKNHRFSIVPLTGPQTELIVDEDGNLARYTEFPYGEITVQSGSFAVVPEPSSLALLSILGVGGMAYRRLRGKKST